MTGFILRAVIAAGGLWLAAQWVDGFSITSTGTLLIAAALLGIVNAVVRPIAVVLTFPITIVTLGLFLLVVNAGMVGLVAAVLPDFTIAGFWPAVLGALVVSIVSWIGSCFIGSSLKVETLRR
ncbi:MAG: phage holin family protein [Steroidobacteraceae bacterium]